MLLYDKKTKWIQLTRGDMLPLTITTEDKDGNDYIFKPGDIIRFKVFEPNNVENVVIQDEITISEETKEAILNVSGEKTKVGDYIENPVDYWYEVELNPDTAPQTIIGYELKSNKTPFPKVFTLLPEGGKKDD